MPGAGPLPERTLLRMILREFGGRPGLRLFRNNVGVARYPDGARVAYGLCPGAADLIGFRAIRITPAMSGQSIAQFVAIEVKGPNTPITAGQRNFLRAVATAGGTAVLARALADVGEAVGC